MRSALRCLHILFQTHLAGPDCPSDTVKFMNFLYFLFISMGCEGYTRTPEQPLGLGFFFSGFQEQIPGQKA